MPLVRSILLYWFTWLGWESKYCRVLGMKQPTLLCVEIVIDEGSRRVELPRNINTGSKTCVIVYRNNESDIVYHTCDLIICFASVEPVGKIVREDMC